MNGIERLRELVAAGEKAPQTEALCDESGWAHWWTPGMGTTPIEYTPAERDDSDSNPYAPYTFTGVPSSFICKAANARQALSDVLALVESVRRLRTTFAPQIIEGSRHSRRLLEVKHEFDVALAKLTSADAQEVGE